MSKRKVTSPQTAGTSRFLSLRLKSRRALHRLYLPFIRDGGLFLPSLQEFHLGESLLILLQLPEQRESQPLAGRVVWIRTAEDARGKAGVGVQFSGVDGGVLKRQIEALLSEFPTPSSYRP